MEKEIKTTVVELEKQGKAIQRTHDAVLKLPEKLRRDFVTQDENELQQRALALQQENTDKAVSDLENDRKWIVRLVVASVVIAALGLVIKL